MKTETKELRSIYFKAKRILMKDGQKLITAHKEDWFEIGKYYTMNPETYSTYWINLDLEDVVKNPEKYLKTNIEYW